MGRGRDANEQLVNVFSGIVDRVAEIWNDDEDIYPVFPWLKDGTPSKIGIETSGRQELWGSLEEVLEVVATHGYEVDNLGKTISVGMGVIGMVAKKQRMMRMANLGAQRKYMQAISKNTGNEAVAGQIVGLPDAESQVAIPMKAEDRLLGVLSIESKKINFYNPQDETLVTTLATVSYTHLTLPTNREV